MGTRKGAVVTENVREISHAAAQRRSESRKEKLALRRCAAA